MADLSITTTTVIPGANPVFTSQLGLPPIFAETCSNGMPVYFDATLGKWWKGINTITQDSDLNYQYTVSGIVVAGGALNQRGVIQVGGQLFIGATVVLGLEYYLSANFGGICTISGVASGHRSVRLCYADSTTSVILGIVDQGTTP